MKNHNDNKNKNKIKIQIKLKINIKNKVIWGCHQILYIHKQSISNSDRRKEFELRLTKVFRIQTGQSNSNLCMQLVHAHTNIMINGVYYLIAGIWPPALEIYI